MSRVLLMMALAMVLFAGCGGDSIDYIGSPFERPTKPKKITFNILGSEFNKDEMTLTMSGYIIAQGYKPSDIAEYGFACGYDYSTELETEYTKIKSEDPLSNIVAKFPFEPKLGYSVSYVMYVKIGEQTIYSDRKGHIIPGSKVSVTVSPHYTDVTFDRVTVWGSCQEENIAVFPITERGFCYINIGEVTSGRNPNINDSRVVVGEGEGEFTTTITGLKPAGAYRLRAYAINTKGVTYSNNYLTIILPPSSAFVPYTWIDYLPNTAPKDILGMIDSDRSYYITEKGFCYNKAGLTPTLNDTKIVIGEGLGNFKYTIDLPPGKYYFRSYAINAAGVGYSSHVKEIIVP